MIPASYEDKAHIINILCNAFDNNISVNYVIKNDVNRLKRIKSLMDYSFELCFKFGKIWLSDCGSGCAMVIYPDEKKFNISTLLLDLKLAKDAIGLFRLPKIIKRESQIKALYPSKKITYLWFLGVETAKQKNGVGSLLLEQLIGNDSNLRGPLYLETSNEANVHFYQKAGFQLYQKLDVGYTLYCFKYG